MARHKQVGQLTRPRASSRSQAHLCVFITAFTKTKGNPLPTLPEGGGLYAYTTMAKNDGSYNTASPDRYVLLKEFAHKNKQFATEAESLLWEHIRAKQLAVKFNRQHIIDDYIVDFVCIEKKLIVEVDGGYHSEYEQIKKDELRTTRLNEMGFNVIRFSNEEILGNILGVINQIKDKLNE